MGVFKAAMDVYILCKFGGLLSGSLLLQLTLLNCVQLRHQSVLGLIHQRPSGSSTFVFRYYLLGATLMYRAGYTLGFATYF